MITIFRNRLYVIQSLELHLFFARIMKEHSLFLMAGFTPVDASFAKEAEFFKNEFEKLLSCAVELGDGVVSRKALCSGELTTEFTMCAEEQTQRFTGIPICTSITLSERAMRADNGERISPELARKVCSLNKTALKLVCSLISLKERILNRTLSCRMFTVNYPLLLEHILREASLYRSYIRKLEANGEINVCSQRQTEQFWNQIMMEHALFIRGLLDPSECELIHTADCFADDFKKLLQNCRDMQDKTLSDNITLDTTKKLRDFKAAGARGIQECKIRSIILPLLADHVLREANHYIRLLES